MRWLRLNSSRGLRSGWRNIDRGESESWQRRARLAAEQLGPVDGVADLGCGLMMLERYLAPGTKYVPVDKFTRDDRTIVCDFDREPPPETGVPAVACLGLIGYLVDPVAFVATIARQYKRGFVTYKVTDRMPAVVDRRRAGVLTDYSAADFERVLADVGWTIENRFTWESGPQMMWLLSNG